jgi:UDP-N-acetyl-2-amino-2-deoxyglucuronate dehydrogenase
MQNFLNFGIVGCGNIAARHAKEMAKVGRLIAVADIVAHKAEKLAGAYQANSYTSFQELIATEKSRIDVMVVCSPNGHHCQHTIESIEAGFHVLCEKPMAITSLDAKAMIAAAKKNAKELFIVKQNRFNPPVVAVKKVLDENKLGKIYSFQLSCFWNRPKEYYNLSAWKGSKELDGGVLYTQFSHFIDVLCWFFGKEKNIQAQFANFSHQHCMAFEDTGMVLLEFENGVMGTINYNVNAYPKNMEGSLTIFGENGTVKVGGQYLNTLAYQQIANYEISNLEKGNTANEYDFYEGSMSNHDKVYNNLVGVLQGHTTKTVLPEEALNTVTLIEKIYGLREEWERS